MPLTQDPNKPLLLLLACLIVLAVVLMMEAWVRIPADCAESQSICDCTSEAPSCWLQKNGFWY